MLFVTPAHQVPEPVEGPGLPFLYEKGLIFYLSLHDGKSILSRTLVYWPLV